MGLYSYLQWQWSVPTEVSMRFIATRHCDANSIDAWNIYIIWSKTFSINYLTALSVWHMTHGITLHLALRNSNCYYLLWSCSTNLSASTTAGHNCNYCSSQHHHVPSRGPSFTQPLPLLLPSLMHFSQPLRLYQVHSLQLSFNEDSNLLLLGKPPGKLGTNYYARNQLLARNHTLSGHPGIALVQHSEGRTFAAHSVQQILWLAAYRHCSVQCVELRGYCPV